jgi:Heterokaryon incompatibility protein Het-C
VRSVAVSEIEILKSAITNLARCLGQGLHTMEDFGAHTNYCELALRELGYRDVFPHCGVATEINVRGELFASLVIRRIRNLTRLGHHIYPLVTGKARQAVVAVFHHIGGLFGQFESRDSIVLLSRSRVISKFSTPWSTLIY